MDSSDSVKDHYRVLGVDKRATVAQIKRAYRAMARARHPDLGGNAAAMRELNEAYQVLSNEAARKAYDGERGFSGHLREPDSKWAPPRTESLGIHRPDRDLLWLTTRGIICALVGGLWLIAAEDAGLHRPKSLLLPWLMRSLGIATIGIGILFGYTATRLAQQKMSRKQRPRPERHLLRCRIIFRAAMAGFVCFLIFLRYMSK